MLPGFDWLKRPSLASVSGEFRMLWRTLPLAEITLAFGFLASKEVKAAGAGNAGIQDRESTASGLLTLSGFNNNASIVERLALKWVQKYISAFGGDPKKVTIQVIFLAFVVMDLEHKLKLLS